MSEAAGPEVRPPDPSDPDSLHCAHCRKFLPLKEYRKSLPDFLTTIDNDPIQGQVTVLEALAGVVGLRLLLTGHESASIQPETLCICGSCEQLLVNLFVAHRIFTMENSFIVGPRPGPLTLDLKIPIFMDKGTQTDFDNKTLIGINISSGFGIDRDLDSHSDRDLEEEEVDMKLFTCDQILEEGLPILQTPPSISPVDKPRRGRGRPPGSSIRRKGQDRVRQKERSRSRSPLGFTGGTMDEDGDWRSSNRRRSRRINYSEPMSGTEDDDDEFFEDADTEVELESFPCTKPDCDQVFASRSALSSHRKSAHAHTHPRPTSANAAKIRKYVLKHPQRKYSCNYPDCGKLFQTSSHLARHRYEESHSQSKTKRDKSALRQKQREYSARKPRNFKCSQPECGKTFHTRFKLERHRNIHLPPGERVPAPRKYICSEEECGRSFTRAIDLRYHQNVHLPVGLKQPPLVKPKKFQCPEPDCGQMFVDRSRLKVHANSHLPPEEKVRPFECPHCNQRFTAKSACNTHVQRIHCEEPREKVYNFLCTVCGKAFAEKANLKIHMGFHENKKSYKCKICGKGFNVASGLRMHGLVHTSNKPVTCDICGKSFKTAASLNHHMVAHTNERIHKCHAPACSADFNYRHHLKEHFIKCHKVDEVLVKRWMENPALNLFQ